MVSDRLREARRGVGWSQTRLAAKAGVSFQQLQKYEQGTNRIPAGRLWRLSKALGQPVGWFFEGAR